MASKLTALFSGNPKNNAETQLQAILTKLLEVQKDIPAAYDRTVAEISEDIRKYRSDAETLLGRIREDVSRRTRKISSIEAQKTEVNTQIDEANARFGAALADDDDAAQNRILKELQDLNSKKATFDGLITSLSSSGYSIGAEEKKQLQTLKGQAAGIADKIDKANDLFNAIKAALAPLDSRSPACIVNRDYLFIWGTAAVEHVPEISTPMTMPRYLDASSFAFFEGPATLKDVMEYLADADDNDTIRSNFTRPDGHFNK